MPSGVGDSAGRVRADSGAGHAVAALYSVVLVSLANIQVDLKDPLDGLGEDDVRLDVADFHLNALG